jgi:hypothetical protein
LVGREKIRKKKMRLQTRPKQEIDVGKDRSKRLVVLTEFFPEEDSLKRIFVILRKS